MSASEPVVLLLGSGAAGKSSLLRRLVHVRAGDGVDEVLVARIMDTAPTAGVEYDLIKVTGHSLVALREVGAVMRPNWQAYFNGIKKLCYVWDGSMASKDAESLSDMIELLSDEALARTPIAVFVNKWDANTEDAARTRQSQIEFLLEDFSHLGSVADATVAEAGETAPLRVIYGSAKSGAGISELCEWLAA